MGRGIFILGTDTDVGKTFVTAGITYTLLNNGLKAISFKPVQSGGYGDVKFVKDVCNIDNNYEEMNTYTLKEAVSPHLAAEIEGVEIDIKRVKDQYNNLLSKYDYVVVEGAGGIVVPLKRNYYNYDLVNELKIPTIIVAKAGVGTINHTILTYEFAKSKNLDVRGIVINNYNNKFYEDDNIKEIKKHTGLQVVFTLNTVDKPQDIHRCREEFKKKININTITNLF